MKFKPHNTLLSQQLEDEQIFKVYKHLTQGCKSSLTLPIWLKASYAVGPIFRNWFLLQASQ